MMEYLTLKQSTGNELEKLCRNSADSQVASLSGPQLTEWIDFRLKSGPAISAYYAGRLVGAAGLQIVRPGIANVWAVIDSKFEKLPAGKLPTAEEFEYLESVLHAFIGMRDILARRFKISRIRTYSRRGFAASQRLLRVCGFKRLRKSDNLNFYFVWEAG
jgi:hypothetical protein